MSEERITGALKEAGGKVEKVAGDVTGDKEIKGQGVIDEVTGAVQNSYGKVKDAVSSAASGAGSVVGDAGTTVKDIYAQGDARVREKLGDNGPTYLIAGAALLVAGAFGLYLFNKSDRDDY